MRLFFFFVLKHTGKQWKKVPLFVLEGKERLKGWYISRYVESWRMSRSRDAFGISARLGSRGVRDVNEIHVIWLNSWDESLPRLHRIATTPTFKFLMFTFSLFMQKSVWSVIYLSGQESRKNMLRFSVFSVCFALWTRQNFYDKPGNWAAQPLYGS